MPRPSHVSPDNILRFLQVRTAPASTEEIAAALHIRKADRRPLFKMLTQLKKRRAIEELPGGRYRLPDGKPAGGTKGQPTPGQQKQPAHGASFPARDELKGRLVLHHDGYGFVVLDIPAPQFDGDVFIPRDAIEDAMHGDNVLVKIQRLGGVSGARRAEGRIVRVLDRAHPTVVGLFRYGSRVNVVLPYDVRMQHEIEIPSGEELTPGLAKKLGFRSLDEGSLRGRRMPHLDELDGAVVNVEMLRFPRGGVPPAGRVIEVLGRPGDFGVDIEILIRKHHLPHVFPYEVLERSRTPRRCRWRSAEREGRGDFRHLPIVTIDGETARDFDDAVYVERRADRRLAPAGAHRRRCALRSQRDRRSIREARLRGTSVYFPDRAVPMLPEELSNGICSLKPREDRLVMSALLEFDARGRNARARIDAGRDSVGRAHDLHRREHGARGRRRGDRAVRRARASTSATCANLALMLNARRNERGSIDFDLPEPVLEFDEQQRMTGIMRSERNIAHRLIEEFMLAANQAVALISREARHSVAASRARKARRARRCWSSRSWRTRSVIRWAWKGCIEREIAVRHGRVPAPAKAGRPRRTVDGRERGMRVALPGSAELRDSRRSITSG